MTSAPEDIRETVRARYAAAATSTRCCGAPPADLKNDAWWVVETGASGWPKSPHYGDQYERWQRGEMIPMWTDLALVRNAMHGTLTLTP